MKTNRRRVLQGLGGALTLPLLESISPAQNTTTLRDQPESSPTQLEPPLRFLVVGNPFGMHPDHFFPREFGKDFQISTTLQPLDWLKDRLTILSHTDHGMKSGHGREIAFLSGVLPETSHAFPEKNMSIDQIVARQIGSRVRFSSIYATLDRSIRLSWNANGIDIKPYSNVDALYNHLFLNLTEKQKQASRRLMQSNQSILDAVDEQFSSVKKNTSHQDRIRLDQYEQSVRDLESNFATRQKWMDRDKPSYDLSKHYPAKQNAGDETTVDNHYNAFFDMVAYAYETDLTRVATIGFSPETDFKALNGINRGYHACTHNGKKEDVVDELVAIEQFQMSKLSQCLKKLDSIKEPNSAGTLLDHTVVLFGSGMGYGGTHSNRNLPILIAGGGLKHLGHVDTRDQNKNNMPLCNLYVALLQHFGIERDSFNTSTAKFDFG